MLPIRRWSVLVVLVVAGSLPPVSHRGLIAADQPAPIPAGSGSTTVTLGTTELTVFTYKPDGYDPKTGALLLVFHGTNRNADEYRDFAKPLGDKLKALVAAPLFPNSTFPNELYQFGGLRGRGQVQPKEKWTWSLIPKLADELRHREGRPDMPFDLIGHSAGGQFLSRMAGFVDTGARRVVAANPGSHLLPTRDQPFPYGFGSLPDELSNDDALRRHLAQPLTIYLGTGDVVQDRNFPRGAEAMKQGDSRYQRGQNAFKAGQELAKQKGWRFHWTLVEAPDIPHDGARMFSHPNCTQALAGASQGSGSGAPALDLGGGLKMEFVRIPHGKFVMGSPPTEKGRKRGDEENQHEVEITRDFDFGKYEVTRGQFAQFVRETNYQTDAEKAPRGGQGVNEQTGQDQYGREYTWKNPGFAQTDDHPVVIVTWDDAQRFCEWLSKKTGKTARLPTEAEWEYACRAGTTTRFHSGDDAETRVPFANMADATAHTKYANWPATQGDDGYVFTAPVGKFKPNAWGLYDMHGNVYEWCQDWFGPYTGLSAQDPVRTERPNANSPRVIRGGAWKAPADDGRSADRHRVAPSNAYSRLGFRVVLRVD